MKQKIPIDIKKEQLKQAYQNANNDEGQQEAIIDWKNTLNDGLPTDLIHKSCSRDPIH